MPRQAVSVFVVVAIACAACSAAPGPGAPTDIPVTVTVTASAQPAATPPTVTQTVTVEATPAESSQPAPDTDTETTPASQTGKLGGPPFIYTDGLEVKVGKPTPFKPSETASADPKSKAFVVMTVTVTNNTKKNFDPSLVQTSAQSNGQEAVAVFDSENGINNAPTTMLLPGRSVSWKVVFGVSNPKDLVVQVTPDFDHDPAIFTS